MFGRQGIVHYWELFLGSALLGVYSVCVVYPLAWMATGALGALALIAQEECLKWIVKVTYIVNVTLDAAVTKILAGNSRKSNFYLCEFWLQVAQSSLCWLVRGKRVINQMVDSILQNHILKVYYALISKFRDDKFHLLKCMKFPSKPHTKYKLSNECIFLLEAKQTHNNSRD